MLPKTERINAASIPPYLPPLRANFFFVHSPNTHFPSSLSKLCSQVSKKDSGKAYGSMVIYVTKNSEAKRLLDGQYFYLAGESAYTTAFVHQEGPIQRLRRSWVGICQQIYRMVMVYFFLF